MQKECVHTYMHIIGLYPSQVVEPKKAIVDKDVAKAEESANAANAIKKECEDALSEALPILVSPLLYWRVVLFIQGCKEKGCGSLLKALDLYVHADDTLCQTL